MRRSICEREQLQPSLPAKARPSHPRCLRRPALCPPAHPRCAALCCAVQSGGKYSAFLGEYVPLAEAASNATPPQAPGQAPKCVTVPFLYPFFSFFCCFVLYLSPLPEEERVYREEGFSGLKSGRSVGLLACVPRWRLSRLGLAGGSLGGPGGVGGAWGLYMWAHEPHLCSDARCARLCTRLPAPFPCPPLHLPPAPGTLHAFRPCTHLPHPQTARGFLPRASAGRPAHGARPLGARGLHAAQSTAQLRSAAQPAQTSAAPRPCAPRQGCQAQPHLTAPPSPLPSSLH